MSQRKIPYHLKPAFAHFVAEVAEGLAERKLQEKRQEKERSRWIIYTPQVGRPRKAGKHEPDSQAVL